MQARKTPEVENPGRVDRFEIHSVLPAPIEPVAVQQVLKNVFPEAKVTIYTSSYSGATTIRVSGDNVDDGFGRGSVDLDGYPDSIDGDGKRSDYLLNGEIQSTAKNAVAIARRLVARLAKLGMDVQLEVYADDGTPLFDTKTEP